MSIKMVPDVGAPLTVVGVDLLAESFIPTWAEYTDYIMTVGGYLAGWMGWGGDYVKNIGVASLPLTARKIYDRVRGGTTGRLTTRSKVSRFAPSGSVSRSYMPEFESVAPHAF